MALGFGHKSLKIKRKKKMERKLEGRCVNTDLSIGRELVDQVGIAFPDNLNSLFWFPRANFTESQGADEEAFT